MRQIIVRDIHSKNILQKSEITQCTDLVIEDNVTDETDRLHAVLSFGQKLRKIVSLPRKQCSSLLSIESHKRVILVQIEVFHHRRVDIQEQPRYIMIVFTNKKCKKKQRNILSIFLLRSLCTGNRSIQSKWESVFEMLFSKSSEKNHQLQC